jgi:hypothetical protein
MTKPASQLSCPKCSSVDRMPIVYGHWGVDDFEASRRGEVMIGGCVMELGMPRWHCRQCGERYGETPGALATSTPRFLSERMRKK